jgi:succinyl-diaminopimelate desuccinylase
VARAGATAVKAALAYLDEAELIDLTRALIRICSVVRPGDADATEAAVARHVEAWLTKQGFDLEVQEVAPGRPNVVAWLGEKGSGKSLLLEGHTDVVTEGNPAEWTHPPFGADLVDGRIYGRGAADMKSGLAAAMVAATAIKRSGVTLNGRLVVGALVDEEGDMIGAKHLCATAIGRELTAAIICEPEQNELCLEQKGVLWARVTVHGRMAHGAMPYAGVNPIAAAGQFLARLPTLERRLRRGVPRSRFLGVPHVTPTVVMAPMGHVAQNNVIPASAELRVDVRLTPGLEPGGVLEALEALAKDTERRCPGSRVAIEPIEPARPATRVDRGEEVVQALEWALRRVSGRRPVFGGVPGSTDGTILRTMLGIPIVTFGPGNRLIPHQVDERVPVGELVEAARAYAVAALRYLSHA